LVKEENIMSKYNLSKIMKRAWEEIKNVDVKLSEEEANTYNELFNNFTAKKSVLSLSGLKHKVQKQIRYIAVDDAEVSVLKENENVQLDTLLSFFTEDNKFNALTKALELDSEIANTVRTTILHNNKAIIFSESFMKMKAGKKWNGKIYGSAKKGFTVYLNGEKVADETVNAVIEERIIRGIEC
jgi:hypothetical protein